MRKQAYELLHGSSHASRMIAHPRRPQRLYRNGVTTLILLSVANLVIATVPVIAQDYNPYFHLVEGIVAVFFGAEYLVGLWAAVEDPRYRRPVVGRLRYAVSFFALIDLIAILPYVLWVYSSFNLAAVRSLRLFRLLRLGQFGEYSKSIGLFTRVVKKKKDDLAVAFFAVGVLLIVASTVVYYVEHAAQPTTFGSIPEALWWGVVTLTTIGYGDAVPITVVGRIITSFISLLGVGVVALPAGILTSGFIEESQLRRVSDHPRMNDHPSKNPMKSDDRSSDFCPHCGERIAAEN